MSVRRRMPQRPPLTDPLCVWILRPTLLSAGFNDSEDYVEYRDDIYVGYRYFETVEAGGGGQVRYPFSWHGLSYTSFGVYRCLSWTALDTDFTVQVKVTNTGDVAGCQVAWVYFVRRRRLGKPHRVLVGSSPRRAN